MTAKLYHADLWGTRDRKYDWLLDHDLNTTEWQEIHPKSEFYFFVPRDERHLAQYETFRKITDIFPVNSVGIVTSRDKFVIDDTKDELVNRIQRFRKSHLIDRLPFFMALFKCG